MNYGPPPNCYFMPAMHSNLAYEASGASQQWQNPGVPVQGQMQVFPVPGAYQHGSAGIGTPSIQSSQTPAQAHPGGENGNRTAPYVTTVQVAEKLKVGLKMFEESRPRVTRMYDMCFPGYANGERLRLCNNLMQHMEHNSRFASLLRMAKKEVSAKKEEILITTPGEKKNIKDKIKADRQGRIVHYELVKKMAETFPPHPPPQPPQTPPCQYSEEEDRKLEESAEFNEDIEILAQKALRESRRPGSHVDKLLKFLDNNINDDAFWFGVKEDGSATDDKVEGTVAGTVGELPLHLIYLYDLQVLCAKYVKKYKDDKIAVPFKSIAVPFKSSSLWKVNGELVNKWSKQLRSKWEKMGRTRGSTPQQTQEPSNEGGTLEWFRGNLQYEGHEEFSDVDLFVGETALHIAIVNKKYKAIHDLVHCAQHQEENLYPKILPNEKCLECRRIRGWFLRGRAKGVFFKPKLLLPYKKKPMKERMTITEIDTQGFLAWMFRSRGALLRNRVSTFHGGETPFHFAAGVGDITILQDLERVFALASAVDKGFKAAFEAFAKEDPKRAEEGQRCDWKNKRSEANEEPMHEYIDEFGNNPLHIAAHHGKMEAFHWIMAQPEFQGFIWEANRFGLTPLTLVAKDSNLIFFQEILKKHFRELVWVWGNYASYGTNLAQLDTYRIRRWDRLPEARPEFKKKNRELYLGWRLHNTPHYRSALEIIVNRQVKDLINERFVEEQEAGQLDLSDTRNLVTRMINEKWNDFVWFHFLLKRFIPYIFFVVLFTILIVSRCKVVRWTVHAAADEQEPDWMDEHRVVVWSLEYTIIFFFLFLLVNIYNNARLKLHDLDLDMDGTFSFDEIMTFLYTNMPPFLDLCTALSLFFYGIFRLSGAIDWEIGFMVIASVFAWSNAMSLFVPYQFFGIVVITIHRMLVGDVLKILVLYVLLVSAFGLALFALLQSGDFSQLNDADQAELSCQGCDTSIWQVFRLLVFVSLGEVDQTALLETTMNPGIATGLHMIYILLNGVLLLNLLIAMMSSTYEKHFQAIYFTWFWPYADLVLMYDRDVQSGGFWGWYISTLFRCYWPKKYTQPRHRLGQKVEPDFKEGFCYFNEVEQDGKVIEYLM